MKYFTEDHAWVEVDGDDATIGISEYALSELGDVTFVELPAEDEDLIVGDILGTVEGTETSADIYAPISGTVFAVNDALENDPELLNDSPEDKGWICKISNFESAELDDMMNETAYVKYLRTLER